MSNILIFIENYLSKEEELTLPQLHSILRMLDPIPPTLHVLRILVKRFILIHDSYLLQGQCNKLLINCLTNIQNNTKLVENIDTKLGDEIKELSDLFVQSNYSKVNPKIINLFKSIESELIPNLQSTSLVESYYRSSNNSNIASLLTTLLPERYKMNSSSNCKQFYSLDVLCMVDKSCICSLLEEDSLDLDVIRNFLATKAADSVKNNLIEYLDTKIVKYIELTKLPVNMWYYGIQLVRTMSVFICKYGVLDLNLGRLLSLLEFLFKNFFTINASKSGVLADLPALLEVH